MGRLRFPSRPLGSVQELERAARDLIPQLERNVINGVAVGTSVTPIAHGLGSRPSMVHAMPKSNVTVWEPADADAKCIYLQASAACLADVEVLQ